MYTNEINILLDADLEYYMDILEKAGAQLILETELHDLYYSDKPYEKILSMSEEKIESGLIKLRGSMSFDSIHCYSPEEIFYLENFGLAEKFADCPQRVFLASEKEVKEKVTRLESLGFYNVIDTFSRNYHFKIDGEAGEITLSEVDNIGLILGYNNPDYEDLSADFRRKHLIDDLRNIGFDLSFNEPNIQKLKSILTNNLSQSDFD